MSQALAAFLSERKFSKVPIERGKKGSAKNIGRRRLICGWIRHHQSQSQSQSHHQSQSQSGSLLSSSHTYASFAISQRISRGMYRRGMLRPILILYLCSYSVCLLKNGDPEAFKAPKSRIYLGWATRMQECL